MATTGGDDDSADGPSAASPPPPNPSATSSSPSSSSSPTSTPTSTRAPTPTPTPEASAASPPAADLDMEVARRFLDDENVRSETRERKAEFLRSKGLGDKQIETLLGEARGEHETRQSPASSDAESTDQDSEYDSARGDRASRDDGRAPIITYPEFLAWPPHPPPLVTPSSVLAAVYSLAGVTALAYGASTQVVGPMVDSLNEARGSFYETASWSLATLIGRLEGVVSENPVIHRAGGGGGSTSSRRRAGPDGGDDGASEYEDPTELFHRDIGTQTLTPPPPPRSSAAAAADRGYFDPAAALGSGGLPGEPASHRHARQIARLVSAASLLRDDLVSQAEDLADCRASMDVLGDELDGMTRGPWPGPGPGQGQARGGSHTPLGGWIGRESLSRIEPDDEIKRVKENIRRVKGVLLSSRTFPGFR